jgi:plasmid stability protein
MSNMSTTITIRTDGRLRRELARRAAAEGKSLSDLIRAILENAIGGDSLAARIGHLKGRLRLPKPEGPTWRKQIRERNWRP